MQNFENQTKKKYSKSYKKTVKTSISHHGIELIESEIYTEIPESTNIKSSINNLKSYFNLSFNKLIKIVLTSEGIISFFEYFKEPIISTLIKILVFLLFMLSEISST